MNILFGMFTNRGRQAKAQSETKETTLAQLARRPGRPRDAEATREEILVAAMDEFSEKGRHGARIEELAARTATSKHMIYYYFASKDGLYAAALARAYEDFRRAELALDYATLKPVEALVALAGNTFDAHIRNPHVVRMLMSENLDRGRHAAGIDHAAQRELVVSTTRAMIERGVAAGLFRADIDPVRLHLDLSALSFFTVANRYTFGRVFQLDMGAPAFLAQRRADVIEIALARCLTPAALAALGPDRAG